MRKDVVITGADWRQEGLRTVIGDDGLFLASFKDDEFKGKFDVDSLYINKKEFYKIKELVEHFWDGE